MTRNGDKKLTDATLAEYETFYGKYHRPIQTGIKDKILKHLDCKENNLHLEENQFEIYRLADISDAILHFLHSNKLAYEAMGLKANWYQGGGLAALLTGQIMEAPIVKARVKTGTSEEKAVFNDALFFAPGGRNQEPFVAMLSHSGQPGDTEEINIGLVMRNHKRAAAFASEFFSFVENRSTEKSIFRRKAVQPAISKNGCGIGGFSFIDFPAVEREQIVLDKEIWEQLHRNLFLFYDKRKHLQGSNIALKRGILLSGEPGTGKTLLCQHIVSKFSDYTTIYVPSITAVAIGAIVNMAKRLQPALLILEDVDLVAQDRIHQVGSAKSVLGELMNQMEGFSSADDIVFLFTTNNLLAIEPAIIARPGRIDHIIELPKPNPELRLMLLKLYAKGIGLKADLKNWVKKTDGLSPSAIKELVKKACSSALSDETRTDGKITVFDRDLEAALADLNRQMSQIQGKPETAGPTSFPNNP